LPHSAFHFFWTTFNINTVVPSPLKLVALWCIGKMSGKAWERDIYRRDAKATHNLLTPAEREKLIRVSKQAALKSTGH
jgi:hypothetical protein